MSFKIDVLIIHSESDNKTSGKHEQGWVSNFQKFLNLLLQQVLGEMPNIMVKSENDKITGADINTVAVTIPVLSKAFLSSGKTLDLLEEFAKNSLNEKTPRIFKVLKQPIKREEQPSKIQDLLPYELYFFDPETHETTEYNEFFSEEAEYDFWMKMVDLAYDIHESLILLKAKKGNTENLKSIFSRKTVYLAETGHDLTVQRNIIKRELQRHGYKVIPDHILPTNVNDLGKDVEKELERADFSIHLIGSSYGDIPEGSDKSIVDVQNQLAIERSNRKDNPFVRLVWIPTDLSKASEKQRAFIENLKRDNDFSESAGILQTPLEDFKNIIREELRISGPKKRLNLLTEKELSNGKPSIYVLHDKVDEKDVKPFIDQIKNSGYEVLTPIFKGELMDLRQTHINNLQRFDAAIIYQNKVNDQWVRMKLLDLLKAPGFGRHKPIKGRAVISEKDPVYVKGYTNLDITLIGGKEDNKMDSLREFLKNLN